MKLIIIAAIVLITFLTLFSIHQIFEKGQDDKTQMTFYSDSINIHDFTEDIENHPYFKGYNNTTLNWLKTLDGRNVVFSNNDTYVIMGLSDVSRIPLENPTDVIITETVKCYIKEKRPLGRSLRDIVFVEDVEFVSQNITYIDV